MEVRKPKACMHPSLGVFCGNSTPLTCNSPHRPHRRAHQGLPLGPLAPVRRVAAHPPAPARGHQDRRVPLRPVEAAWAQRRPPIHPRARGEVRRGLCRCARGLRRAGPARISSSSTTTGRRTRATTTGRCREGSPCRSEGVRPQRWLSEVAGVPRSRRAPDGGIRQGPLGGLLGQAGRQTARQPRPKCATARLIPLGHHFSRNSEPLYLPPKAHAPSQDARELGIGHSFNRRLVFMVCLYYPRQKGSLSQPSLTRPCC